MTLQSESRSCDGISYYLRSFAFKYLAEHSLSEILRSIVNEAGDQVFDVTSRYQRTAKRMDTDRGSNSTCRSTWRPHVWLATGTVCVRVCVSICLPWWLFSRFFSAQTHMHKHHVRVYCTIVITYISSAAVCVCVLLAACHHTKSNHHERFCLFRSSCSIAMDKRDFWLHLLYCERIRPQNLIIYHNHCTVMLDTNGMMKLSSQYIAEIIWHTWFFKSCVGIILIEK